MNRMSKKLNTDQDASTETITRSDERYIKCTDLPSSEISNLAPLNDSSTHSCTPQEIKNESKSISFLISPAQNNVSTLALPPDKTTETFCSSLFHLLRSSQAFSKDTPYISFQFMHGERNGLTTSPKSFGGR